MASNYVGNNPKRYWGTIWTLSAVYFVIMILPWLVLSTMADAGFLFFALIFALPLGYAWLLTINDPQRPRPDGPMVAQYDPPIGKRIGSYVWTGSTWVYERELPR